MSLQNDLIKRAKANKKTIVFPEAGFSDRVMQAGEILANNNIVNVVFVGNDWEGTEQWIEYEKEFKKYNCDVVYLPHTDGISSTILRKKIK